MPAPERPERIGIFGGTFDPPHRGHVAAARAVRRALALDRLLLVVANDPWQKSTQRPITPAEDRYALTEAMAAELPGAEASRLEIDRGGPSYSVETAEELVRQAQAAGRVAPELFLVIGADLVPDLETWERAADLRALVTLGVVSRPAAPADRATEVAAPPPGWRLARVDGPLVDVSSSAVRDVLRQGGDVSDLVPEGVVRCIRRRNLYAVGR